MTEKIESFSSRKLAESKVMTTQNILREARLLKNVIQKDPKQSDVKEEDDLKEEKEEQEEKEEEQHRSFSRTGNDLIETDDELVEVRRPVRFLCCFLHICILDICVFSSSFFNFDICCETH